MQNPEISRRLMQQSSLLSVLAADDGFTQITWHIMKAVADVISRNGVLLTCGNGGSASQAQHLAAEVVGRFRTERAALPAVSLTADSAVVTALGNDFGFDQVFARQLDAWKHVPVILAAFTTSGNSLNVVNALRRAQDLGMTAVCMTGGDGGMASQVCPLTAVVPSRETSAVQEVHEVLIHLIADAVDALHA